MTANRQMQKIYFDGKKVVVEYVVIGDKGQRDEHKVTCQDIPKASFIAAIEALRPVALELVEAPPEWDIEVRGVSLRWTTPDQGEPTFGCVIKSVRPLETSGRPLVLNTPYKAEQVDGDGEDAPSEYCLSPEQAAVVGDLVNEAWAYIDGDRAQGTLPFGEPGGEDDDDEDEQDAG